MKTVVYVPGVWDLLHIGHIKFLERASKFGDVLVVGVEDDESVALDKGQPPIISLSDRMTALESLKCVDVVVPYGRGDYLSLVENYSVNVFVLSEIHRGAERFNCVIKAMEERKGKVVFLPYYRGISSTEIKKRVFQQFQETNPWKPIWEEVGRSTLDDITVNSSALDIDKVMRLARYFKEKLAIVSGDSVLDFGCGSGMMLRYIECRQFGIDVSLGMIERAVRNCPKGTFIVDDHIPFKNRFDHIICYGVLHYLPSVDAALKVVNEMRALSDSIMIMELPDLEKKAEREENRRRRGKPSKPEHLYFGKLSFGDRGFTVFDNELSLTNNSDYGFTALW